MAERDVILALKEGLKYTSLRKGRVGLFFDLYKLQIYQHGV